ncbi:MAG: alkaline phosphatase family protein [Ginsengibacter sp.]
MKNVIISFISVFFILTGCDSHKSVNYPKDIKHIIIIGVDGMSQDGIRSASTPVMHKMIADGSVKWGVRTVLPSSSSPNWESMISGAGPEQHGVTDNDWERTEHSLPPVVMDNDGIFPTIFEVIRKSRPNAEMGAVYNWSGFGRLFEKKAVNYDTTFSTVDSTVSDFSHYIEERKPMFAFIQMDNVDHAGHTYGWGTDEYYLAVSKADSLIGEILKAIQHAGIEGNSLVIVTADHGGKGYGHGGATPQEAEKTIIYYGKDVKKNYVVKQPVYAYDLAATVAFSLGLVPPYAWIGRPVKSIFEGFSEPQNLWPGKKIIASPIIFPKQHLYQEAGGLYIDTTAVVKMQSVAQESTIRYTLNGSDPDTTSQVYNKPFSLDATSVVKAKSFDSNGDESLTSVAYFRILPSTKGKGLHTSIYLGNDWKSIPVFSHLHPLNKWISHEFELNYNQIKSFIKTDNFGVVFEGYIDIDSSGKYTFYTASDDGSELYIDGNEVVNNDGSHGVISNSGDIELTKGRHAIRVEYFNSLGGFWLDAYYKGPGLCKQIIPANKLFLTATQ